MKDASGIKNAVQNNIPYGFTCVYKYPLFPKTPKTIKKGKY
jgi:hypothetical protein